MHPGPNADSRSTAFDEIAPALHAAFSAVPGIVSAYVFGSAARGELHRDSDVDVGVLLDRSQYSTASARFEARLRLIALLRRPARRDVDVVILNDAPPHLARRIMWEGRSVVVNDPEADHAQRRLALLRAADVERWLQRTRAIKRRVLRS
jgi:predicted nucleotidyltransferase